MIPDHFLVIGCLKTAKGDNDNAILVMKQIKEGGQDRFRHRCRVASQKLFGPDSGLLYTSNSAVDQGNQDATGYCSISRNKIERYEKCPGLELLMQNINPLTVAEGTEDY